MKVAPVTLERSARTVWNPLTLPSTWIRLAAVDYTTSCGGGHVQLKTATICSYVGGSIGLQKARDRAPFATVLRGGTGLSAARVYGNIDGRQPPAEIGWTWVSPVCKRTG